MPGYILISTVKISNSRTGEMAQWLKALVVTENLGSFPSTHMIAHKHPFPGYLMRTPSTHGYTYMHESKTHIK